MEVSDSSNNTQYSSFQEIGKKHRVIKCIKCESYFIENNKCESCGQIQNKDLLGMAFGEKSVFFRKELFVENRPWYFEYLSKASQIKTDHVRQYKRFLSMRLKRVVQQFDENVGHHKLEFRVLVNEYLTWGGDISWVMGLISQGANIEILKDYANKSYDDFISSTPENLQRYKKLVISVAVIALICSASLILLSLS